MEQHETAAETTTVERPARTISEETFIAVLYTKLRDAVADALISDDIMEYQSDAVLSELIAKTGPARIKAADFDIEQVVRGMDGLERYSDHLCPYCGGEVGWTGGYDEGRVVFCRYCQTCVELQ